MSRPGDDELASRVRDLESEVTRIRDRLSVIAADAGAARVLAAGADREVSDLRTELRAHLRVLNALRETQLEQKQEIDELRTEMRAGFDELRGEMRAGFDDLRTELRTEMRAGFDAVGVGMALINARLEGIAGSG